MYHALPYCRIWLTAATLVVAAVGCDHPAELGPVADATAAANIRKVLGDGADSGAAAEEASGTGWGTIKGRFVYGGDPPAMPPYKVDKDESVCAAGGQPPLQQFLVVDDASKGIANIAVYPRKVTRVNDSAKVSDQTVVFDQKECVFLSHVFAFGVGQPVEIKNSDSVGHNTKIEGQNASNQTIPANGAAPYTAKREEATPAPVHCSIHPWMSAWMLPRSNAYFAVTHPDGSFEIANLPAGEKLEIQVWHESAGARGEVVVDSPEAKELKWTKKGRFTVTLDENQTLEVDITVPPTAFRGN